MALASVIGAGVSVRGARGQRSLALAGRRGSPLGRAGLGIITTLGVLGHVANYYTVPYIDQIENLLYDTRVRLSAVGGIDDRIAEPSRRARGQKLFGLSGSRPGDC